MFSMEVLMNILVVTGYNPFAVKDGNAMRVCAMLRELIQQEHNISLLIYTTPWSKYKKTQSFYGIKQYIFSVRLELLILGFLLRRLFRLPVFSLITTLLPPFYRFKKTVKSIIQKDKIDIIQCENTYTVFQISKYVGAIPIVVSALDILYDRYVQILKNMNVMKHLRKAFLKWWQRVEINSIKRSSICACVSDEDRNRLIEMGIEPEKLVVIPNGVDCDSITPMPKDIGLLKQLGLNEYDPILFFGGSGQYQNIKALHDIIDIILPRTIENFPNLKIIFIGTMCTYIIEKNLCKSYSKNIINAGYVENLNNYYSLVDIVILPITIGSGTKLKAGEAFAAGKAVISTSMGAIGYDVIDGEDVIIEDCIDRFPDQIRNLLDCPDLRRKLGKNAREKSSRYDWKFLMKKYDEIYQTLSLNLS